MNVTIEVSARELQSLQNVVNFVGPHEYTGDDKADTPPAFVKRTKRELRDAHGVVGRIAAAAHDAKRRGA